MVTKKFKWFEKKVPFVGMRWMYTNQEHVVHQDPQ